MEHYPIRQVEHYTLNIPERSLSMKPNQTFIDFQMSKDKIILIHEQKYTKEKLEKALLNIKYKGRGKIKDLHVENGRIPSIAKTFYLTLFHYGLPSPEQLINMYFLKHKAHETEHTIKFKGSNQYFSKTGVEGRIYRTYPSLIRDYHFFLSCKEMNEFDDVFYSFRRDQDGVDTVIKYKGQEFAIALFVDTPRSRSYKKKKYNRHETLDIPEICITINPFDKSTYIGDYALYQKYHIDNMIKEMRSVLETKESVKIS